MAELDTAHYDVVVVGFGGAGAVAALAAAEAGAHVAIIEKMPRGGGNTRESGGSIRLIADRDKAVDYFERLARGGTPREVIQTFVDGCNPAIEWLKSLGLQVTEAGGIWHAWKYPLVTHNPYPGIPGVEALGARVRIEHDEGSSAGEALWAGLGSAVSDRQIDTFFDTRVIELVSDPDTGRICGVDVMTPAGKRRIEAASGVVLACGGFSGNKDMLRTFLGMELPAFGVPGGNAGDGIRLAQSVGADLWHMTAIALGLGYQIPGFDAAFRHHVHNESFIYVDQTASRFVDEVGLDNHAMPFAFLFMDPTIPGHPRLPGYFIFGESARRAGPVVQDPLSYHRRDWTWSADNSVEVERGWIHKGETIGDLARSLGLSPEALEKTIVDYNRGVVAGPDPLFGRPQSAMAEIDPPYYGIELWPCLLNTQGGPRRGSSGEVFGLDGRPIAGLFAAGELGSMWTELYPGAGNVSECIVSGMQAGRAAARGVSVRA